MKCQGSAKKVLYQGKYMNGASYALRDQYIQKLCTWISKMLILAPNQRHTDAVMDVFTSNYFFQLHQIFIYLPLTEQLKQQIILSMVYLRKTAQRDVTIQHLVMIQNGKFMGQVHSVSYMKAKVLKMKDGNQSHLPFQHLVSTLKENLKNVALVSQTFSSKFQHQIVVV